MFEDSERLTVTGHGFAARFRPLPGISGIMLPRYAIMTPLSRSQLFAPTPPKCIAQHSIVERKTENDADHPNGTLLRVGPDMIRTALLTALLFASPVTARDLAFVTSQDADKVSVIDLQNGRVLAETVIEGAPAPVAYDPAHGRAYVISAETGVLSALDEKGRVVWRAGLGRGIHGVASASDGGVFVTHWYGSRLMRFNAQMTPLWSVPTGKSPVGVAVSTDNTLVATADRDAGRVSIFDAVSGRRLRVVTTGEHPHAVTFHDGRLWTTDAGSDTVTVIDPISGRVSGTVAVGRNPFGIAFARGLGFVTNQYDGTVSVFEVQTLRPVRTLETGDNPEGISALPDGSGVAVVHRGANRLMTIDAQSLNSGLTVNLPDGPRAFGSFTGRSR